MKWFPVELHTHSCHSDGDFTIQELVKAARKEGYRALALTDHNTASGTEEFYWEAWKNGLVPICGLEWTTYWGHMVVLEEQGYTDWRRVLPDEIDQAIISIHKNRGIVGIAHPFALSDPINTGYRWNFHIHNWSLVDYIEVWSRNYAPNRVQSERAMEMWENLLDRGYHITAMTGRDWHRDDGLPCCYTWIGVDETLTRETLLSAICQGRVCLTAGPLLTAEWIQNGKHYFPGDCIKAEKIIIESSLDETVLPDAWNRKEIYPEEIRVIMNGREIRKFVPEYQKTGQIEVHPEPGWMRVDLFGTYYGTEHCRIGMTNPVYIL